MALASFTIFLLAAIFSAMCLTAACYRLAEPDVVGEAYEMRRFACGVFTLATILLTLASWALYYNAWSTT